jgi:protein ImuB
MPDRPRTAQLMLFGGPSVAPDKLPVTIARLAAILGPDRVGRPVTVDGHKPERFAVAEFDLDAASDQLRRVRCEGYSAVRSVRPAVEVEAVLDESGRPRSVRSMHNDGTHPEISGEARIAAGPWRLEEGWWLEDAVDREYWDVELADGGVYRLYRDARAERWYCDGIYD